MFSTSILPNNGLIHASKSNPCPHCGKTDWCYSIGELSVCKRQAPPASGWTATTKTDSEGTTYYAHDRVQKERRPELTKHFCYPDRNGNPLIRVTRVDDGNGKRNFYQERWNGKIWEKGLKGVDRSNVPIYRCAEVRQAIERGEVVFVVEGEGVADELWKIGIPATTNIGGSKKWGASDTNDLKGASIVICPDRDKPGLQHADRIAQDFPDAHWLYAFPSSPTWERLPDSNGLDLADWIADYKLSREQIFAAIEPTRRVFGETVSAPKSASKVVAFPKTRSSAEQTTDKLRQWVRDGVAGSALRGKLNDLAGESGWLISELEKLYYELTAETEAEIDRGNVKEQIDTLLNAKVATIDLAKVLPPQLAKPLTRIAEWQNLRPETYLIALLTAVSSLHKNGTELELHRAMDFAVSPNLFGAIVAESSQKKSPIVKTVISKPLNELNRRARDEYEAQLEEWRSRCQALGKDDPKPPEPQRKIYSFNRTTGESILRQASRHPEQGLLWLTDELPGLFKSANQYRGGKGSDLEDMLSYYDGSGGLVLRAEGVKDDVDSLNLGIFGGIQPGVLEKFLGDCQDSNGNWARFILVNQPTTASTLPDDGGSIGIQDLLVSVYSAVDNLSTSVYRLSQEAFRYFQGVYNRLEIRRVNEPRLSLRAAWGKLAGRIGKLALNLHVLEAVCESRVPNEEIGLQTLKSAVEIARFSIDQIEALYGEFDGENELAPQLAKVIELSQRSTGGWIKAKNVQLAFTKSKRPTPETARKWFGELVSLGYGQIKGSGSSLEFSASVDTGRQKVDKVSTAETLVNKGVQSLVDKVDKVDDFPKTEKTEAIQYLSATNSDNFERQNLSTLSTLSTEAQNPYPQSVSTVDKSVDKVSTASTSSFRVGDAVAGSDPEEKSYSWHGKIEGFTDSGLIRVYWRERANSENKQLRKTPILTCRPESLRKL